MEEAISYQVILDKARESTRARYAALVMLDGKTLRASVAYFSGANTKAFVKAVAAINKIAPSFSILHVDFKADANKFAKATYIEGKTVAGSIQDIAENIIDKRLLWLSQQIGGLRYGLLVPLKLEGAIEGAFAFYSPRPFTDAQRISGEVFAKQALPAILKLRHSQRLSPHIKNIEKSRNESVVSDPLLRMVSHQFSKPLIYEEIIVDPKDHRA